MVVFSQPLVDAPEGAICRVCHCTACEDEDEQRCNPLVSPCLCDGSVRWVHRKCLNFWRLQGSARKSRATCCELCRVFYLYEVRWIPRRQRMCRLLARNLVVIGSICSAFVILAAVTSSRDSVSVTGCIGFVAAVGDMLPWQFGKRVIWNAGKELNVLVSVPFAEMAAHAESLAQLRALEQAERAAQALSRMRELPRTHEVEMEEVMPPAAIEEAGFEANEGVAVDVAAAGVDSESQTSDGLQDANVELIEANEHRLTGRSSSGRRRQVCACAKPVALLSVLVLLGASSALSAHTFLSSKSPNRNSIVIAITFLGVLYWTAAMLLDLAVAVCGPPGCEPVLGRDGLGIIRSLRDEEREEFWKHSECSSRSI
mmetsp:Transcript_8713/g.15965  ORF Transcript_8713/g.15965 Transcript_8713/m.15965 type:complete len:371 (+) Transcript_8713:57-1169(+)